MSSYKSAFLIPRFAKKILEETGWIFETKDRICPEALEILKRTFSLEHEKSYLDIESYIGDGIKVNVIYDDEGLIEHISIQLWKRSTKELIMAFDGSDLNSIDIFIPS